MKADFTGDDVNVRVALEVHNERGHRSHTLPGDRGHRGAGHTQARGAEKTEDKDGVQDDVGQGAQKLGTHGQVGAAGGLQQPLKGELAEDADGAAQADLGVDGAGGYNLRYVGLELEEGAGEKYPNDAEENEGAQSQKDAGVGGLVRFVLLFCAQGPGEQGVHAHGGARADGDHQVLQGKGQGDCGQGVLTEPGDENAVYHIVQGLDQHGDHHGDSHAGQQPPHRLDAHLVFCGRVGRVVVLHSSLSSFFHKKITIT